jgi:hypothetical protein
MTSTRRIRNPTRKRLRKTTEDGKVSVFKLYYKEIAIKTLWYWHINRPENQWNKIEDPNMNPHNYTHLTFEKGAKNIQWRKENLFNKCCLEK